MIANGALGNTLSEMTDVLAFGYSLEEMNNYNKKLVEALLDLGQYHTVGNCQFHLDKERVRCS